jgi:hypothetical protein
MVSDSAGRPATISRDPCSLPDCTRPIVSSMRSAIAIACDWSRSFDRNLVWNTAPALVLILSSTRPTRPIALAQIAADSVAEIHIRRVNRATGISVHSKPHFLNTDAFPVAAACRGTTTMSAQCHNWWVASAKCCRDPCSSPATQPDGAVAHRSDDVRSRERSAMRYQSATATDFALS